MTNDQESILVVDDDYEVLMALEAELTGHYDVTPMMGAEQALACLRCKDFAAIISDVRMPGIDGLSLIKQCAVRYPNMVRIILTAFDGDDVHETALGPDGAFKLVKPWGDDLLIILQNALKQRKSNIVLRQHLDLKSELLDVDRKLHPDLTEYEVLQRAAMEMIRLPEIICAAIYLFKNAEQGNTVKIIKSAAGYDTPELRRMSSDPIEIDDHYLYNIPIGEWSDPIATVSLRMSNTDGDTLRYLDFIGRQAERTLSLIAYRQSTRMHKTTLPAKSAISLDPGDVAMAPEEEPSVPIDWVSQTLTTPATVITSVAQRLKKLGQVETDKTPESSAPEEIDELAADLKIISNSLSSLLNELHRKRDSIESN